MRRILPREALKRNKDRKRRRAWQKVVRGMAAGVVFITTYALILPAITMEKPTVCGLDAHAHLEECYELLTCYDLSCTFQAEEDQKVIHQHTDVCYGDDDALRCTLEQKQLHLHVDACYHAPMLLCQLPESEGHTHGEACYEGETLICLTEESEGHAHLETCFGEPELACSLEELQLHRHDDACMDAEGVLTCQLPVVVEHIHDDGCLQAGGEKLGSLICQLPAHIHQDACYAQEDTLESQQYTCGLGEHQHTEICVDEEGNLTCSIPEHLHSADCVIEDLDLTQDQENEEVWNAMFQNVELTGNWPEDLLVIANTQLGYQESAENCILVEEVLRGYTRYGDRYGDPYGDWEALFVRFCLEYADISYYPLFEDDTGWTDPARWMEQLTLDGYYGDAMAYSPKAGDLVFFRTEESTDAEQMGIVTEVIPATETEPGTLHVLQGDVHGLVANMTYELLDQRILGYGILPSGYASQMQHTGEDYSITIQLPREAKIPEKTEVAVREILPETDEYNIYYSQSVESLMERLEADSEEAVGVTFARFFDIGFHINGRALEPEAPVSVQIQYAQPIELLEDQNGKAVHFAEDGIEILDAELSGAAAIPEDNVPNPQVDTFSFTQDSFSVVGTVLANARASTVTVWLDGTCGGLMAYEGSDNIRQEITNGVLPDTWKSPTRYDYVLKGWYDVNHNKYYEPGAVVDSDVTTDTVFYADWIAADYSVSSPNEHTVDTMDTSDFVTTYVFDYNALFNMHSVDLSASSAANNQHSETWRLVESGNVDYEGGATLDFIFRDHDSSGRLSHPNLPDGSNVRNEPSTEQLQAITTGIYNANLGNLLFNPSQEVLGKEYLGTGNFLYQYMDDPSDEHYGYYYYDSFLNAASYNKENQRFYVYDYLEYTRDTLGNDLDDTNADFLPFNHPDAGTNLNNQIIYASQQGQEPNDITNFFFGIRSDIHFYLPNDAGAVDANGNYLNKSTTGDDMIFEFSGDDDVWVLLDGQLLLDVGGIHQVRGGRIDFSQGIVYTTMTGSNEMEARTFEDILGKSVTEGAHNLTIYYLERGSSMSNCAIYFNLAPRYGLDLQKEDYITGGTLSGVTFAVYTDEACTIPATLWASHDAAKADVNQANVTNTFTTGANGIAHMWGLVAGKTYYIKETTVPDGYPSHNDLVRVTLNNHGTDISEVTVVRESGTEGFEVTYHTMDKENHLISIVLTNKLVEDQLTDLRAEKQWGEGITKEVPVQVYLMANGVQLGDPVTLSVDNAWGHTWMDLPVEDAAGNTIRYSVDEVYLPGYQKESIEKTMLAEDKTTWIKVGALEDGAIFMIALDSDTTLTASGGSFGTTNMLSAKDNSAAHWTAEAYLDGFRLHCGGYYLTFNNSSKAFYLTGSTEQNQTFYYDGSQLFVMSGNTRYYVGGFGSGLQATTSGDATSLYKKLVTLQGTTLYRFTNTAIPEEVQKSLRVEKYWEGDQTKIPEQIQVYLKRNGETVTTLELTAANNWSAVIDGLDGTALLAGEYTLEEEQIFGYSAEVGEIQDISAEKWHQLNNVTGLTTGQVYTFVANGWALADNGSYKTINSQSQRVLGVTYFSGTPTKDQQWMVVETATSNGTIQVLKNVATGNYLKELEQNMLMVPSADGGCAFQVVESKLRFWPQTDGTGWHIQLNGNNIQMSWELYNGTAFTYYQREYSGQYRITLTNTYGTFVLPHTGSTGTAPYYTFGILLISAAALMYLLKAVCRRQKGGR